ncbi:MAG: PKD domain-containing protein, partial [Acidobacteriota bacterium]
MPYLEGFRKAVWVLREREGEVHPGCRRGDDGMKEREGMARSWALFLVGMLAWIWASGLAFPADLYVDAAFGNDVNDGLSWGTAKATVGNALTAADGTPGADTIYVAEGTYQETMNFWFGPDDVSLIGGFPAGGGARDLAAHPTAVSPPSGSPFEAWYSANVSLDGFILENGRHNVIADSTNITVRNCIIRNNTDQAIIGRTEACGGMCFGVCIQIVGWPSWGYGGGLYAYNSSVEIVNNLIVDNTITLYDPAPCSPEWGPNPPGGEGAGMCLSNVTGLVANNTIASNDNLVPPFYQVWMIPGYRSGGVYLENVSASLVFRDNIMWGNVGFNYCEPAGLLQPVYCDSGSLLGDFSGPGNIRLNPLFATGPGGDYYLSQTAAGQGSDSPCLDAGSDTVAAVGMTDTTTRTDRVEDAGTVDMGYHEILASIPDLEYTAHSFTDCGNVDGFADPGETITLSVTAENTGNADAFNVSGVLSTITPGVTVFVNNAAFPDIPEGLTGASLTPYRFVVDPGVPCGTLIDFALDLTYQDNLGNPLTSAESFQVPVGQPQPPLTLLLTDFEDCADPPTSVCPPCVPVNGDWTVINNGNKVGWTHAGPGCPSTCEWGLFPTNYYICDTTCPGWSTVHNEELISPVIDTSAAAAVTLRFDHDYYNYSMPTTSDLNVRSSLTGGAWVTLRDFADCWLWCSWDPWMCDNCITGPIALDATAQCAGAADCQFEFHQVTNYYDSWWWAVDNVAVEAPVAPVCSPAAPPIAYDTGFDPTTTLAQVCGDGDLIVEPGEEWQATVQLINSAACTVNNVKADLTVNPGSAVAAAVCNNPGDYGNIPAGGTAQFTYSFVVDTGAVCINDITFDVTGIVSDEGAYPGEIPAFAVQVGALAPGPTEPGAQATDPLTEKNGTISSDFTPAFTIPGAAKSATLSYVLSGGTDLVNCVEVALVDPLGTATVVKPLGAADANPYDVTGLYTGAGTYQLQLTEAGKGCGGGGSATLTAGTLSVTAPDVTECDVSACSCPCPTATISESACDCSLNVVLDANPSGGTPPYTYLWSTGETSRTIVVVGDGVSSYDVTVTDANSCQGSDTYGPLQLCVPCCITSATATALGPTTFCTGGSVDLVATPDDGIGPFTYLWSTGDATATITVSAPGTYSCDVTDNDPGCGNTVTTNSIAVTVNENPVVAIFGPTETCEGGCVTFTVIPSGGTPPYDILWCTGETTQSITLCPPVGVTTCTVTATDANGCVSFPTIFMITVNENPTAVPTVDVDPACEGAVQTFTANNVGGDTFLWNFGDGDTSTLQNPTHTYAGAGSYTVTLTVTDSATGCTFGPVGVASNPVEVNVCVVPSLVYSGHSLTDCGNANGAVDPGETIDLDVTAQNTGGADAFNVSGTLSTITPGITITTNTAAFPDIAVGLTGTSLTPFQFVVDLSVPCGTVIDFTLDLAYEDGVGSPFSNAASFQVQVSVGGPVT